MKYLNLFLLLILAACSTKNEKQNGSSFPFFIGTYAQADDEGIFGATINTATGELSLNGLAAPVKNPSFLTVYGNRLFTVCETGEGSIMSFGIDNRTMLLFPIDTLSAGGDAPCYISLDPSGFAGYVANYSSGNVLRFELDNQGRFTNNTISVQHEGSGPDTTRQSSPHAHSIKTDPAGAQVLAADLGADRLFIYEPSTMEKTGEIQTAPGAGPRHFTFNSSGTRLYVMNELNSTIEVYDQDFSQIQVVRTLPADWSGPNSTADIHLHPDGKTLYGSNRGHNSIVSFSVDEEGKLDKPAWITEGIEWPRNFAVSPDGAYLLVASQKGNSISSYPLADQGRPGKLVAKISVPRPVCIEFYGD